MPGKHWTEKEIEKAIEMCKQGKGTQAIADKLGRPADGVRAQLAWQRELKKRGQRSW